MRTGERRRRSRVTRGVGCEALEQRLVLSAWPDVFARFAGEIAAAEVSDVLPVAIRPQDFQAARRAILIGFDLRAADGSLFDPGSLTLLLDDPGAARIFHRDPEALNARASVLLADVRPGTYQIDVKADAGLIGPYELGWYLAGDVNGDRAVTARDLKIIRANIGARTGDAGVPLAADVDRDGQVTRDDLRFAAANLGVRTRIRPIQLKVVVDGKQADPEGNGLITRGDIQLVGKTTRDARVQVDVGNDGTFETTATADRAGRFRVTALVGIGRTTIRVVATDALGQTADELINIVRTDEILNWNETALVAAQRSGLSAPETARVLAMVHAAMNDTLAGFDTSVKAYHVENKAPAGASRDVAIVTAAQTVLAALLPRQRAYLNIAAGGSLAPIAHGPALRQGIAFGQSVAGQILRLRANDGSSNRATDAGGTAPGQWRPTSPGNLAGQLAAWGSVKPFLLRNPLALRAPAPPNLTSNDYADAYRDVQALGRTNSTTRTLDQTAVARFWNSGADLQTLALWNRLARDTAIDRGFSMAQNAQAQTMLALALADASIAAFDSKYTYGLWRPITAIRAGDADGNDGTAGDSAWTPLLSTPATPGYVSEQSAFAGAAEIVLGELFGVQFAPTIRNAAGTTRNYMSLAGAAEDAGRSQVYAGTSFEFDNQRGLTMGRDVGRLVLQVFA